eukprot:CCRYP_017302-RA/>CCRYP_017302-RA protein AED:0.26 eAED:0.49 QI:0/0/0/1/0/0/2/0/96
MSDYQRTGVHSAQFWIFTVKLEKERAIPTASVALNTANQHGYDVLMEPGCYSSGRTMPGTAHDMVCEFILDAAKVGMEVEITDIDQPDVDKGETDR